VHVRDERQDHRPRRRSRIRDAAQHGLRNTVYSYDPATNKWTTIGTMPGPRSSVISGAIDDKTLITTTGNNPDATTATWIGTVG
jgi:hypothetical protein